MRVDRGLFEEHSFATTHILPPEEVQEFVKQARAQIDRGDLDAEEGYGGKPHATLLYGLADDQEGEAVDILRDAGPLNVRVAGVDVFEPGDYDVVIFKLESDDLQRVHDALDQLPNSNEWPDYNPHMTIAYVKPGLGKKYAEKLESDLIGKNFVANQAEFSDTADNTVVVDLREGTTEAFENLSEQSPLFGTDVLTEEPDEGAILAALYPVLNRANRRATSINQAASGQTSVLLDDGHSLDMMMQDGSWWASTGVGSYDLMSPTDQERLVKELSGMLESARQQIFEATAIVRQDGYDLLITFQEMPTRETLKKPDPTYRTTRDPETGEEKQQQEWDPSPTTRYVQYLDRITNELERNPELNYLGEFRKRTQDTVQFVPHYQDWNDTKEAASLIAQALKQSGAKVDSEGDFDKTAQITSIKGVGSGGDVQVQKGGWFRDDPRGGGARARGERPKSAVGKPAPAPAAPAPAPAPTVSSAPATTPVSVPKAPAVVAPAPKPAAPKKSRKSTKRARKALTSKKSGKRGAKSTPVIPVVKQAADQGPSEPRPGQPGYKGIRARARAQNLNKAIVPPAKPTRTTKKKGRIGGKKEDTYTSDVSFTDTIPVTPPRPTRKKKRRSEGVKLPGIKDAARRRISTVYRVLGESESKYPGQPIRLMMRPSQVRALHKKPVWSALSESGVIQSKPYVMSGEEFFEVSIDVRRNEWSEANRETLLAEVNSVAPQAYMHILEHVEPSVAAREIVHLVEQILEAQAEAELDEGPTGRLADWIRGRKLQGSVVGTPELKEHLLGSYDVVREILEGIPIDKHVLKLLKSVDQKSIAVAAGQLLEDENTSVGANLGSMADPSGAAAGSVTQGYGEQDVEQDPGTTEQVAVSSRNWEPGAMFELHVKQPDGSAEWEMREVVGHEGEDESSRLVYKDDAGNIMDLSHEEVDAGLEGGSVRSPDELGVESEAEIPTDISTDISEPVEEGNDPEADRLNKNPRFTQALATYQQSKDEKDWAAVQTEAQKITGKAGPELDRILGQFAGTDKNMAGGNPPVAESVGADEQGVPNPDIIERKRLGRETPLRQASADNRCPYCGGGLQNQICTQCRRRVAPAEGVSAEFRTRVTEDTKIQRCVRRFGITQNEAYLLQATDRAVRMGVPNHTIARRLVDELAGTAV